MRLRPSETAVGKAVLIALRVEFERVDAEFHTFDGGTALCALVFEEEGMERFVMGVAGRLLSAEGAAHVDVAEAGSVLVPAERGDLAAFALDDLYELVGAVRVGGAVGAGRVGAGGGRGGGRFWVGGVGDSLRDGVVLLIVMLGRIHLHHLVGLILGEVDADLVLLLHHRFQVPVLRLLLQQKLFLEIRPHANYIIPPHEHTPTHTLPPSRSNHISSLRSVSTSMSSASCLSLASFSFSQIFIFMAANLSRISITVSFDFLFSSIRMLFSRNFYKVSAFRVSTYEFSFRIWSFSFFRSAFEASSSYLYFSFSF